jgi:PAS domain S-box-containing protein
LLLETDATFMALFQSHPMPMWVYDLETLKFVTVNDAAIEQYGYSEDEFLRLTIRDIRPLEELASLMRNLARPSPEGVEKSGVWKHRRRDGTLIDVEITSHAFDFRGRACRFVLANDVTQRERAKSDLFESRQMLRYITDHMPQRIFWKDLELRYLGCNDTYARDAGVDSPEFLVGKTDEELRLAERAQIFSADERSVMTSGMPRLNRHMRVPAAGGGHEWLVVNRLPLYDQNGRIIGVLGSNEDITERMQSEAEVRELNETLERRVAARTEELQRANDALEAFSYSVSHDLRAPLRAVNGFAELLQREHGTQLDPAGRGHLARIHRAAQRMDQLIEALLGMAFLSRRELRLRRTDLSELSSALADELAASDRTRTVTFCILPQVVAWTDPELIRVVLQNLLNNAWKYSARREKALIEFGVSREDGKEAVYYVRDNGTGFDMAYAHKLFAPFQRLHSLEEFEGTGIGLANVQRIIHRHGGRVWVDAVPDQGATFFFTLDAGVA